MTDTTRLGLPLIEAGQAQKHVTHNEALRILDTLVQAVALDRDIATPPTSPAAGAGWIVAASPTGGWTGHAGHLAIWIDEAWSFVVPQTGWCVWLIDENRPVYWTGTLWKPILEAIGSLADLTGIGIRATPDATNRLSVRAPAALFAAELAASGGSGDVRLTVEKETLADTASLLFQTNWSGRAEIGVVGDDDLRFKVSADGATWVDALRIVAATGQLVVGSAGLAGGGRLKAVTAFNASGTWTRADGIRFALVFVLGAGGGGGGAAGSSTTTGSAGGGGAAGALSISFLDVTAIASRTVTVGAGGTAGATTAGVGGTGGTSSFGTEVVAAGGVGGNGMTAGTTASIAGGGTGGSGTAGDLQFAGAPGGAALRLDGTNVMAGVGGASFFGGGGRATTTTNSAGSNGTARGSGASGATVSLSATSRAGGVGAAGFVWVWEFE